MEKKFKDEIEFRRMQEAVASMLNIKDEYAKGMWGIFKALVKEGFTREEALKIVLRSLNPNGENIE